VFSKANRYIQDAGYQYFGVWIMIKKQFIQNKKSGTDCSMPLFIKAVNG
jgi:hypothetical protein